MELDINVFCVFESFEVSNFKQIQIQYRWYSISEKNPINVSAQMHFFKIYL